MVVFQPHPTTFTRPTLTPKIVEEMPDIHVEREPAIYEPNRLGELKRILEAAEKKAAEMESAGGYRPWRTNLPAGTTQQNHLVSIRPVDKDQLDEEPRVEVSVENRTAFMPESLGGAGTVIGRNHKSRLLGMSLFSKRPKTTPTPCPKKRGQDEG